MDDRISADQRSKPLIFGENPPRQLYRSRKYSDVPKNAQLLSQQEVADYVLQEMDKSVYRRSLPVLTLKYGYIAAASLTALTGIFLTRHYRKVFKLRRSHHLLTYGISASFPAFITSAVQWTQVTERILTGYSDCPICLSTRGGLYQIGLGVFYPVILSSLTCIIAARKEYTYSFPDFRKTTKFMGVMKGASPSSTSFLILIFGHFLFASFLFDRQLVFYERIFGRNFDPPQKQKELMTDINNQND